MPSYELGLWNGYWLGKKNSAEADAMFREMVAHEASKRDGD